MSNSSHQNAVTCSLSNLSNYFENELVRFVLYHVCVLDSVKSFS
jgi:hypothetical protein